MTLKITQAELGKILGCVDTTSIGGRQLTKSELFDLARLRGVDKTLRLAHPDGYNTYYPDDWMADVQTVII